jgi:hypothetical protein
MRQRISMGVIAICMSVLLAHGASAKNTVLYKIGKLRDFIGIVIKDGKMFAPFEMIEPGNATKTMKMLVKLGPGGLTSQPYLQPFHSEAAVVSPS